MHCALLHECQQERHQSVAVYAPAHPNDDENGHVFLYTAGAGDRSRLSHSSREATNRPRAQQDDVERARGGVQKGQVGWSWKAVQEIILGLLSGKGVHGGRNMPKLQPCARHMFTFRDP